MTATEHLSPDQFHPHINFYRDGGMGGVGPDKSVTGYVRTSTLASMPGNRTNQEGIERHREALRSGQGFKNPVMVMFNPETRQAIVGEGNHRVAAAAAEGVSHVPVRVVRDRFTSGYHSDIGGRAQSMPSAQSKWKGGLGEEYWPSDMHPSHIFDPSDLLHDRRSE